MYRCLYCQLNFDDWGIILQHGCLENSSAIGITSENVVYLEQDEDEVTNAETMESRPEEQMPNIEENEMVHKGWTEEAVLLLISQYAENKTVLERKNTVKKHIWKRIADEMSAYGHSFMWDQVQNKWKSLMRTYKSIRDNNNETGRNRTNWGFYDAIDRLVAKNPTIDPPVALHNGKRIVTHVLPPRASPGSTTSTPSTSAAASTSASPVSFVENVDNNNEDAVMETAKAKRQKKMDSNELLLLAIEESKRQHQEDIEEKRKFNRLLESFINNMNNKQ